MGTEYPIGIKEELEVKKRFELKTDKEDVIVKVVLPRKVAITLSTLVMMWSGSAQALDLISILHSTYKGS